MNILLPLFRIFTDYPYGVFITPLRPVNTIAEMQEEELQSLGKILKEVTGAFDALFHRPFSVHDVFSSNTRKY